jgi:hypothetical protein
MGSEWIDTGRYVDPQDVRRTGLGGDRGSQNPTKAASTRPAPKWVGRRFRFRRPRCARETNVEAVRVVPFGVRPESGTSSEDRRL